METERGRHIERVCNSVQPRVSPKWGFVMGSRSQGIEEILEKKNIGCPHPHHSELGDGMHGAGPLKVVLNSNSFADNL